MGLRDDGMIGISAILTEVETGQDAHSIATADTFDTGTCGKYRTRCFEAHLRRKGGLVQIASCAEHDVSAVETNRLDFNAHLAGTRIGYFALFQAKHIRSTQRVQTDDTLQDRKSDVTGKRVSERVDIGGRRIIKKKK